MPKKQLKDCLAYPNAPFERRLAVVSGVNHLEAALLFKELKRFLWLSVLKKEQFDSGQTSSPTLTLTSELYALDQTWHVFLVFTRDYQKFCDDYLGVLVPHEPVDPAAKDPSTREQRHTKLKEQLEWLEQNASIETVKTWYQDIPAKLSERIYLERQAQRILSRLSRI